MKKFFDEETGILRLDEMVVENPSFKKIMADNVVTDEEIKEQSELVISLLKSLENELSDKEFEKVSRAITEMSVLYAINQYKQLQNV